MSVSHTKQRFRYGITTQMSGIAHPQTMVLLQRHSSERRFRYTYSEKIMTIKNLTNAQIIGCALRGEDAQTTTGNMSTEKVTHNYIGYYAGKLPKVWRHVLSNAELAGRISQVIYSYSTPIAWHDSQYGWIVPAVTYSPTTSSRHQTHLYKLRVPRTYLPYDATPEDAQRVLDKKMYFTDKRSYAGPAFIEGE